MPVPMFEVMWDYESSYGGPWMKGDKIKLEPGLAAKINDDSPGVLVDTGVKTKKTKFGKTRQLIKSSRRDQLEEKTVDELRDLLRERDLKVRGLKDDLIDRLLEDEEND